MFEKYKDTILQAKELYDKRQELQQKYDKEISAIRQGDNSSAMVTVANVIRTEMKETFELYKKEMEEIHERQSKQLRTEAMWQWVILIAVALAALIKEIYF